MKKSISAIAAALLACVASQAIAADSPSRQAERDLFAKIVEIPTVEGRTAEFGRLTALLTAEFRKARITNVVVKDHDGTQTLIARWLGDSGEDARRYFSALWAVLRPAMRQRAAIEPRIWST